MKKRILSLVGVLMMTMLFGMTAISASAANMCTAVQGNVSQTVTFTARVGKNLFATEKIVLTQNKGVKKLVFIGGMQERSLYGHYRVSVYDETGNKWVYNNKKWEDRTFTISSLKLHNGHSYRITVKGLPGDSYSVLGGISPIADESWVSYSTWRVSKTGSNITFCE